MGGELPPARNQARRRRWPEGLALAGVALLAAVWCLSRLPGPGPTPAPEPRLPLAARSSVAAPPAPVEPWAVPRAPAAPPRRRDPLLEVIPPGYEEALIVQVNALVHSPLGKLWLACLDGEPREVLSRLQEGGFDPLVHLDRLAVSKGRQADIVAASGHFARADPAALVRVLAREGKFAARNEGGGATLFTFQMCFFECFPMSLAVWQDQALVIGEPERVRASVDLLRGTERRPVPFAEDVGAADVFAVVPAIQVARELHLDDPVLKAWLSALEPRAVVRVDAARGVRAEARVTVEDPAALGDLAGLFASAVAAELAAARKKEDRRRAELLEHVTVSRGADAFTVGLDLPQDALERQFADCE